jgi:hypothetical protein
VWQAIYEDLRDEGLEIIAVAFDTAGKPAVEAKIRAADCKERPEAVARLVGWAPDLWRRQAPPTYPCLIDENHSVGELYGMVNVPQSVWIDEAGRIVRPAESAGAPDMVRHLNRETLEIPEAAAQEGFNTRTSYVEALRDWVKNGAQSPYALSADEVRRRMSGPSDADVRAATHVRLGRHFYLSGSLDSAKRHFNAAVQLCPDKWFYRRQAMMLDPESIGELNAGPNFWAAIDALGDKAFYEAPILNPT